MGLAAALGKRKITIAATALWLIFSGCAIHRGHRRQHAMQLDVPNDCIVSLTKTDKTECHGDDINSLHCTGIGLIKKAECETVRVIKEK